MFDLADDMESSMISSSTIDTMLIDYEACSLDISAMEYRNTLQTTQVVIDIEFSREVDGKTNRKA